MNWIYTGVYFADLVRLALVMCGIFGFSLSMNKGCLAGGFLTVLGGAVVTLFLQDPSNRIFVFLAAQVLFAVLCLDGKKKVLAEISFLVHFALLTVDAMVQSIVIFIWYDGAVLSEAQHVGLNAMSKLITLIIVIAIAGLILNSYKKALHKYMVTFNLKLFFYYFICIVFSGIVIGYAGIMAADQVMIYRYKVALYVASGVLGIVILVFGVLLNVFFIQRNRLREDDLFKQKCIEEQTAQYALITRKNEQLQRFRHDQKAYVLALKGIMRKGDIEQLQEYVDDVDQRIKEFDYIATGNMVGDAILNAQAESAEKAGVAFHVAGRFPERMRITDADLASLLSNAVKNAYEAAAQCGKNRFVKVQIKTYRQKIFLEICNSAAAAPQFQDGHLVTTKKDRKSHGIGTQNMADITEKYDGKLTWEYDGNGHVITKIEI